jgi:Pathogenicity locus
LRWDNDIQQECLRLLKFDENDGHMELAQATKMLTKLTDLPNIGNAIAADLIAIGICSPADLDGQNLLKIFNELKTVMGHRHDPCVYYTLLSVKHFMQTGESLPWWNFTAKGKSDLALNK